MNPRLFHTLASRLVQGIQAGTTLTGGDGAVECRTAVGRAYYFAFLVTRSFMEQLGIRVPAGWKCHAAVQMGLNNSLDSRLVILSTNLGALYTARATADCEMSDTSIETVARAEVMVRLSQATIAIVDAIRAGKATPPVDLPGVTRAILKWARENVQPLTPV
jgi:hypothetical protein